MLVSFHSSKRTGINTPLGDPKEVEEMMGYLHHPTVPALSKVIYGVKNSPTREKSHQVMSVGCSIALSLPHPDRQRHRESGPRATGSLKAP